MNTRTLPRKLLASSLGLILVSCSATRNTSLAPSSPTDLTRYVLIIEEAPGGQVLHSWKPVSSFDLSNHPLRASHGIQAHIIRASFNRDCEAELAACEEMCLASLKGRNWAHASAGSKRSICHEKCRPAYNDCCKLKELAEAKTVEFSAVDTAVDWLKRHREEILVGTVVVIAGVAFVAAVAGSGGTALVLAPAILLVSSDATPEPYITAAKP